MKNSKEKVLEDLEETAMAIYDIAIMLKKYVTDAPGGTALCVLCDKLTGGIEALNELNAGKRC